MGWVGRGHWGRRVGRAQRLSAGQPGCAVHMDSQAWLCYEGAGLEVRCGLLWFAVRVVSTHLSHALLNADGGSKRTMSSLALFMRLKLARYSSSSALKFFNLSCAFSAFVCTGSCLASLP